MKLNLNKEELKGWEYHSKKYEKGDMESKKILIKLNRLRIQLSRDIFNNYCRNMSGSKNITSDYDLTLFLSFDDIKVYFDFLNKIKSLNINLSKLFDMNIYFYEILCNKLNNELKDFFYLKNIKSLNCGNKHLFIKNNYDIYYIQILFSLLKYKELNLPLNKLNFDTSGINNIYKNINNQYKKKNYIKKYELQCNYSYKSHVLFNELNENFDYKKIIEFVYYNCLSRYYAYEGYYTFSTLYVVVYEIALNIKLNLTIYDYYITIIENSLELYHIPQKKNYTSLLSYSKYLYRIYYSWNKIYNLNHKIPSNIDLDHKYKIIKKIIKNRNDILNIDKYKNDLDYIYKDCLTKKFIIDQINFIIDNSFKF